jgi:hypothetical protein
MPAREAPEAPWISVQAEVLGCYVELLAIRAIWADFPHQLHRDEALRRIDEQLEVVTATLERWAGDYVAPELPREART